ncbi:MAG TPA: N-acyl homoserine lactonase family protein [Chloroflexota bacterium]|nr:N-acyl homoserine lactonase family protein [Chloroflexota bacterium]
MKLYVLFLGECCIDKGRLISPGVDDGKRVHIAIPAYLVQTDDGKNILIDTGMNKVHIEDPEHTFRGQPIAEILLPVMRREDYLANRLAELNLRVEDITHVINTHLHFDHAGCNALFTHAPIIVQRGHYEAARDNPVFPNENWNLPELHYELIDGEPEIFPGIHLILTPGHAPFHQSVLLNLPESGNILLCSDAIYCQDNLDHDAWGGQADPATARESAAKLLKIAEEQHAYMIYGHDPAQWKQLRHAPDFYA